MDVLLTTLLMSLLALVCLSDLFYRKIPNRFVILVFMLGVMQQSTRGNEGMTVKLVDYLLPSMGAGLAVLAIGFLIYLGGRIGAGDIKLLAALAVWFGHGQVLTFLVATALFGGMLALCLPLLEIFERRVCPPVFWLAQRFPARIAAPSTFDAHRPVGIPYGLAIAMGASTCLL